jgi:ubiquinone/menaquinone biosynthesis C-methylase UbiE
MKRTPIYPSYDRLAPVYDRLWQRYLARTIMLVDQWTPLAGDETVLDVACGTGLWAARVLQAHPQQRVVGVDRSVAMLRRAARRGAGYPHVAWQAGSATALPFASARFDVVVCASALHYFDDPHAAVAEMTRVLKLAGRVVILDWCRDGIAMQVLDRVLRRFEAAHRQTYTAAELQALLGAAGLRVAQIQQYNIGVFWKVMVATAQPIPASHATTLAQHPSNA